MYIKIISILFILFLAGTFICFFWDYVIKPTLDDIKDIENKHTQLFPKPYKITWDRYNQFLEKVCEIRFKLKSEKDPTEIRILQDLLNLYGKVINNHIIVNHMSLEDSKRIQDLFKN